MGLRPPSYYGTEVVARFLGLRYDHPAGTDQLELFPWDPITRAEAAWSLARVIGGRTAAQMAQEIPHRDRLHEDRLRPGDRGTSPHGARRPQ